jgi:hypothetical protein
MLQLRAQRPASPETRARASELCSELKTIKRAATGRLIREGGLGGSGSGSWLRYWSWSATHRGAEAEEARPSPAP